MSIAKFRLVLVGYHVVKTRKRSVILRSVATKNPLILLGESLARFSSLQESLESPACHVGKLQIHDNTQ